MKTKITVYLINGESITEVVDKSRREVEADYEKTLKQKGDTFGFRYIDGHRYIPITSILYVDIKEIS